MSFYTDEQGRARPLTSSKKRYQEVNLQIMRTFTTGIPYARELRIGDRVYEKFSGKQGAIVGFDNGKVVVSHLGIIHYYKPEQLEVEK